MNEAHIKPKHCPFCGKIDTQAILDQNEVEGIDEYDTNYEPDPCYLVCCSTYKGGCGATSGYAATPEKAVAKWNTRADCL